MSAAGKSYLAKVDETLYRDESVAAALAEAGWHRELVYNTATGYQGKLLFVAYTRDVTEDDEGNLMPSGPSDAEDASQGVVTQQKSSYDETGVLRGQTRASQRPMGAHRAHLMQDANRGSECGSNCASIAPSEPVPTPYEIVSDTEDGVSVAPPAEQMFSSGAMVPVKSAPPVKHMSLGEIPSIAAMRSSRPSLQLAYDTEYYDVADGDRYMLSYQFSFFGVEPDVRHDVIIGPIGERPRLSWVLSYLISRYDLTSLPYCKYDADGFTYAESRRWWLPFRSGANVRLRVLDKLDDAVAFAERHGRGLYEVPFNARIANDGHEIRDPINLKRKDFGFRGSGPVDKADLRALFCIKDGALCRSEASFDSVGDDPDDPDILQLGYVNDYSGIDKLALPVTLVAHAQEADLTAFGLDKYERDFLVRCSQVQGGLVTLERVPPVHISSFDNKTSRLRCFYPVSVRIRDSMCYAPPGKKSLAAIGDVIDIPKLTVSEDDVAIVASELGVDIPRDRRKWDRFVKSHMDIYLHKRPKQFCEYAAEDAVIVLGYVRELWSPHKELPVTLISAATKVSKGVIDNYFSYTTEEYHTQHADDDGTPGFDEVFRGLHKVSHGLEMMPDRAAYIEDTRLEPVNADAKIFQDFAAESFHGGKNESLEIGFIQGPTYDVDLENAYLTCMSLVGDPDWMHPEGVILDTIEKRDLTPQDLLLGPFTLLFAYVQFEFPEDCAFPCIPVREGSSLVYPRTYGSGADGVYAAAPELYLALRLHAKVHVLRGYVGRFKYEDTNDDFHVSHALHECVKQFVDDRNLAKDVFGEKSLAELTLKVGGNGEYGKLAQDVQEKRTWSAWKDEMVGLGGSAITSPVHAALITSGVRALLIAAMSNLHDMRNERGERYHSFSVTTDGFITDAPLKVLQKCELYSFRRLFESARVRLTGDPTMWAEKHHQDRLVNFTTRGNVWLTKKSVCAHNSYRSDFIKDSFEDRAKLVDVVLSRTSPVHNPVKRWRGFRELAARGDVREDFGTVVSNRNLHMDFDLKREPVRESMHEVTVVIDDDMFPELIDPEVYKIEHHLEDDGPIESLARYYAEVVGKPYPVTYTVCNFDTVPFDSIAEYRAYRACAIAQRKAGGCLRTMEDWNQFYLRLAQRPTSLPAGKKQKQIRGFKDLEWKRLFCAACGHFNGRWNIPTLDRADMTRQQKYDWMTGFLETSTRKFNRGAWSNAHDEKRDPAFPLSEMTELLDRMGAVYEGV